MSMQSTTQRPVPMSPRPAAPQAGGAGGGVALDPVRILRQYYPWLTLAGIMGVILGVGLYLGLLFLVPRFTAFATFQVFPAATDPGDPVNQTQGEAGGGELDRYMATQVLVMKSDQILRKAIEQRAVRDTAWAKQFQSTGTYDASEALKKLRKIVSARVVPETAIVRLGVTTPSADDAQIIAKTISDVFLDDNRSTTVRETQDLIERFERKVRDLKTDVRALDTQMESLMGNNQIQALNQRDTALYIEASGLQMQLVETGLLMSRTRDQLLQYEQMLNAPGGTVYPEMVRNAAERSGIIQQLDGQIAFATSNLRALRQEFGDNHMSVVRSVNNLHALQEERKRRLETQMADSFATVIESLQTEISNLEASQRDIILRGEGVRKKLAEVTSVLKQYADMQTDRDQKMKQVEQFDTRVAELNLIVQRGARVRALSFVEKPDQVSFPLLIPTLALSIFLVTGAAGGVIVLKELRETRIRSPQDVGMIPRTRVLGIVPELGLDPTNPQRIETASLDRPDGAIAESVRQIRTGILKAHNDKGIKTILIASGMPGSGGTALVCNLAINSAAIDLNVLIIDANVRRPGVHPVFGMAAGPGLSDVLTGASNFDAAVQATAIPGLSVMAAGQERARAYERFTTPSMTDLLNTAKSKFDLVLVDAPPFVVSADALSLASKCDGVVLVVRAYNEKRGLVARLRGQFDEIRAEFLGVVVNAVRPSAGGYLKRNIEATSKYGVNGHDVGTEA